MSEHFIKVCSCGNVIAQCRCPGPKLKTIVEKGCEVCRYVITWPLKYHEPLRAEIDIKQLQHELEQARAEVARLRAAIERHKKNRYGGGDTRRSLLPYDDAELYKALEGE